MSTLLSVTGAMAGRFVVLGAVLLLVLQLFICAQTMALHRHKAIVYLRLLHTFAYFLLAVFLLDGIFWITDPDIPYSRISPAVRLLFSLPWGMFLALELASAVIIVLNCCENLRYAKNHLLSLSIKEAVDWLPVGICFGDKNGTVVLANMKMDRLCRDMTEVGLTDTDAFWRDITARGEDQNGQKLIKMANGEVQVFAKSDITVDGKTFTQIVSSDMTEQYRITQELSRKSASLRDIQIRMKAFQAQASDMLISQEILAARQIVHDEAGHALLAARYYFEHPENVDEFALLAMIKQTNDMFLRETEQPDDMEHDRYRDALKMADTIGVDVKQNGDAPASGRAREILGQAIWECSANTVKHAEGNHLFVTVRKVGCDYSFIVTNNGTLPKKPIIETGGLLSLRHIVENAGGTMDVISNPAFRLSITLPEK